MKTKQFFHWSHDYKKAVLSIFAAVVLFAGKNFVNADTRNGKAKVEQSSVDANWPSAPSNVPGLIAIHSVSPRGYDMLFEAPTPHPPEDDPVEGTPLEGVLHGIFLYAPELKHENNPAAQQYFVLRGIGVSRQLNDQSTPIATYHITTDIDIFDPVMSPDGKLILFKGGWPLDMDGKYAIYLWNTDTKTLRQLTLATISFYDIFWSPDGNYIAYVTGGDRDGDVGSGLPAKQLYMLDIGAGRSRRVLQNPGVTDAAWTQQGTLLVTMRPTEPDAVDAQKSVGKDHRKTMEKEPESPKTISIYEVSCKGGEAKLLISDGYNAVPSPDGKFVAYLSKGEAVGQDPEPDTPNVLIYDREKKTRISLGRHEAHTMKWAADSRALYLMEGRYDLESRGSVLGPATISRVDPSTGSLSQVAIVEGSEFDMLDISNDGRYLVLSKKDVIGKDNIFLRTRESLLALDLSNGKVDTVMSLINKWSSVIGWSWHDESSAEHLSSTDGNANAQSAKISLSTPNPVAEASVNK